MNKVATLALMIVLMTGVAAAQFKLRGDSQPSVSESVVRSDDSGLMFGWFDPNRLFMHQSYSLSYTSFGSGQGMSLGVYTNSLLYQISDPLSVQFDVSLMHQPFGSTMGNKLGSNFSGIYLSRAQLDYRPSKNMLFQISFRQMPAMYWLNNYGYYHNTGFFNGIGSYEEDRADH